MIQAENVKTVVKKFKLEMPKVIFFLGFVKTDYRVCQCLTEWNLLKDSTETKNARLWTLMKDCKIIIIFIIFVNIINVVDVNSL